jgi:DNA polymerase-3 subunit epsilon
VTALTGITNEMVTGQRIDELAVSSFAEDAVVVIARNAGFDRKFAERYWPIFQRKAWGCSATEVEWRKHGFEGSRLGCLLNGAGFFHQAHRAVDDCHALLEILAFELPTTGTSALAVLPGQARKKTIRVWAEQSPFEFKDSLKRRGYPNQDEIVLPFWRRAAAAFINYFELRRLHIAGAHAEAEPASGAHPRIRREGRG